ncbi:MAG TPA: glycosyltransferase family 4 protein, partial [Candidatus Micrarchaeota archaeon]|nr:glycosyltransferase family 4 protein [Candidatus Micrarchaeota archaeon]
TLPLPLFSSLKLPASEFFKAMACDFDIVHIHGYGNFHSFFGAILSIVKNKPLVWTIHGYPRIHGARRAFYYVYRYLMAPLIFLKAKKIISVSTNAMPILRKETRKEIYFIPNGVDLGKFHPRSGYRRAKFACYVGRLDPDKGVFRMLECKSLPVKFIGPDEDGTKASLIAEAKKHGMKAPVFEESGFDGMPAAYESCRYVVLPSKYEGFPMSMLESLAMERPFICTDVGEVKATLSNLLDEPSQYILEGNLESKLAALEKKDLSGALKRARENLATYSWDSIAKRTSEIYLDALGGKKTAGK